MLVLLYLYLYISLLHTLLSCQHIVNHPNELDVESTSTTRQAAPVVPMDIESVQEDNDDIGVPPLIDRLHNQEADDRARETFQTRYPGIVMTIPTKPILSYSDELKMKMKKMKGKATIGDTSQTLSSSRPRPRATQLPPHPSNDMGNFKTFVAVTVCHCGIHVHTFTCKKPPKGWHGCRLCKPSPLSNGTRPLEIASSILTDGTTQWDELEPYGTEYEPRCYETKQSDAPTRLVKQEYVSGWDPDRHTMKEDISPLKSDSSRTIIWELSRPELHPLAPLDDNMTKEDIISSLYRQMISDEQKDGSLQMFKDASERLLEEQVDLHSFNKQDNNNLFYTLLLGMIESSRLKAGDKSVQCIRRELMHHLSLKEHDDKFGDTGMSIEQYIEFRIDQTDDDIADKVKRYSQYLKNVDGDDCFEGGELEIQLFAEMEKFNIAVYDYEHTFSVWVVKVGSRQKLR